MMFEDKLCYYENVIIHGCQKYVNNKADKIFIYASMESSTISFKVCFLIKGEIVLINDINQLLIDSGKNIDNIDEQFKLLQTGVETLEKISELFKSNNKNIPTEIKIEYLVNNDIKIKSYKYVPIYSTISERTDDDEFNDWIELLIKENL